MNIFALKLKENVRKQQKSTLKNLTKRIAGIKPQVILTMGVRYVFLKILKIDDRDKEVTESISFSKK